MMDITLNTIINALVAANIHASVCILDYPVVENVPVMEAIETWHEMYDTVEVSLVIGEKCSSD